MCCLCTWLQFYNFRLCPWDRSEQNMMEEVWDLHACLFMCFSWHWWMYLHVPYIRVNVGGDLGWELLGLSLPSLKPFSDQHITSNIKGAFVTPNCLKCCFIFTFGLFLSFKSRVTWTGDGDMISLCKCFCVIFSTRDCIHFSHTLICGLSEI